jgi:hypothetical protein
MISHSYDHSFFVVVEKSKGLMFYPILLLISEKARVQFP